MLLGPRFFSLNELKRKIQFVRSGISGISGISRISGDTDVRHVVTPVEGLLFEIQDDDRRTSYVYVALHDDETMRTGVEDEPFELTLGFADETSWTFDTRGATMHTNRPKTTHVGPERTAARWKAANPETQARFRMTEPMRFAVMKAWIYTDEDWGPERIAGDLRDMSLSREEKINFANAIEDWEAQLVLPGVRRTRAKTRAAQRLRYMSVGATERLQSRTKTRMVTGLYRR